MLEKQKTIFCMCSHFLFLSVVNWAYETIWENGKEKKDTKFESLLCGSYGILMFSFFYLIKLRFKANWAFHKQQ